MLNRTSARASVLALLGARLTHPAMLRWDRIAVRPASLVPLGLVLAALLPLGWLTSGPSFCPLKVAIGLPCPGCGMTRSVVALMHGDVGASVFYHPLGVILVIASIAVAAIDGWHWWRESRPSGDVSARGGIVARLMVTPAPWVAIAALALVWFARLPLYVAGIWVF